MTLNRVTRAAAAFALLKLAAAGCNPMEATCPSIPAFGGLKTFDFGTVSAIKDLNELWDVDGGVAYAKPDKQTAKFSGKGMDLIIHEEPNAPTITTKQYLFYGKVDIELQAAPGQGIVTAVTLMSDDQDEIDWEFIGSHNTIAESNFYAKGKPIYKNGKSLTVPFDITQGIHKYSIEWTPSYITFSVDGQLLRTALASEAEPGTYPQTPCTIKLGTWLGGGASQQPGTVDWAGGKVDWSKAPFTATFKSMTVTDYGGGFVGATEYSFTDRSGSRESVKVKGGDKQDLPSAPGGGVIAVPTAGSSTTTTTTNGGSSSGSSTQQPSTTMTTFTTTSAPTGTAAGNSTAPKSTQTKAPSAAGNAAQPTGAATSVSAAGGASLAAVCLAAVMMLWA